MSNAALAFMAGLANGGVQGYQLGENKKERDEDRALRKRRADREDAALAREDKLRTDIASAAAPRMAQSAEVYQPTNGNEDAAPGEPVTPMPANPTVGTYKIDDQFNSTGQRQGVYQDQGAAQAAALAANTPQQQADRVASAYMANGAADKAFQVQNQARQAEAADMQLADAKAQREIGSLIARGGWSAVPKVHERYDDGLTSRVEEDGKGGATVVMIDKDGKEAGRQQFKDLPEFFATAMGQFNPKLWLDDVKARRDDERQAKRDDATVAHQNATLAVSQGQLAVAQQNARTNEQYRQDIVENGRTTAAAATARAGNAVDRMPEAEKLNYQRLTKQSEDISKKLLDLQADTTLDLKDPVVAERITGLKKLQVTADLQARRILERNTAAAPVDPLNLRGAPAAPGAGPSMAAGRPADQRVTPQQQAVRDTDRRAILEQEVARAQQQLQAARTPDEQARAQADLAAVQRELGRMPGAAPARMVPTAAPAQPAPAAPAQMAPAPAPAPAPAAPAPRPAPAPAPAPAPKPAPAPAPATGDKVLNKITEKNAGEKKKQMAVYEAEVANAEQQLQKALLSRDPRVINEAATLLTQTRRALELVKQS